MPKITKGNRVITPKPFWVLVEKRTGVIFPPIHDESRECGWPGIYPTKKRAENALDQLGPDLMIRKCIPKLEVLDHD